MRKIITEREVYKKLQLLERHSSFKKPYFNYQTHQHGELYYSGFGFPPADRFPGFDPPSGADGIPGDCTFACNPSMLDCEGGCVEIHCICAEPPMVGWIINDDTGMAWIEPVSEGPVVVCVGDATGKQLPEFPVIRVGIADGGSGTEENPAVQVEVAVVDCGDCLCDEPVITGAATTTQGVGVTLTVTPPCATATLSGNDENNDTYMYLYGNGDKIFVLPGDTACGTITVTLECDQQFAGTPTWTVTHTIRITDAGGWDDGTTTCTTGGNCASPSKCGLAIGWSYCVGDADGDYPGKCVRHDIACVDVVGQDCPDGECIQGCSPPACAAACSGADCCSRKTEMWTWTCDGAVGVC
jgi:hypothetical protein